MHISGMKILRMRFVVSLSGYLDFLSHGGIDEASA